MDARRRVELHIHKVKAVFFLITMLLLFGNARAESPTINSIDSMVSQLSSDQLIQQLLFYHGRTPIQPALLQQFGGCFFNANNPRTKSNKAKLTQQPLYCVDGDRVPQQLQNIIHPRSLVLQAQRSKNLLSEYFDLIWPKMAEQGVDMYFAASQEQLLFSEFNQSEAFKGISIGQKQIEDNQTLESIVWTSNPNKNAKGKQLVLFNTVDNLQDDNLKKAWANSFHGFVVNENKNMIAQMLKNMLTKGEFSIQELRARASHILQLKKELFAETPYTEQRAFDLLDLELRAGSITLLGDAKNDIPLNLGQKTYVWDPYNSHAFRTQLQDYPREIKFVDDRNEFLSLFNQQIIVVVNRRLSALVIEELTQLSFANRLVFVSFGVAEQTAQLAHISPVIQLYANSKRDQQLAAQAVFGGRPITGNYPAILRQQYKPKSLGQSRNRTTVQYPLHESRQLNTLSIDAIAQEAIQAGAFPGCQVVAIHQGEIVLNKSYGHHTYTGRQAVQNTDLYDIASVTKVAGTTLALMHLYGQNELDLFAPLSRYFNIKNNPYIQQNLHTNNLFKTKVYELMVHRSGIRPYLPIYNYVYYKSIGKRMVERKINEYVPLWIPRIEGSLSGVGLTLSTIFDQPTTVTQSSPFQYYYSRNATDEMYPDPIAEKMYFKSEYHDTLVWNTYLQDVNPRKKKYKYSDINFVLLQMLVDTISGQKMDRLLDEKFYAPLGLKHMLYHPLQKYTKAEIVPTEDDQLWRNQLVHGYVHDPSAALLGGMTGNAGLFSNAEDLAKIGQMLLQKGQYGSEQLLSENVVEIFTKPQENGKRGLGFDTAERTSIVASHASQKTFGHTGFTGTCIWVDPDNDLVYVFLSNRIYPSVENKKLQRMHVRERIHDAIYSALNLTNTSR